MPDQLYIDGSWQPAADGAIIPVINPATEEVIAHVAAGGAPEVERAVAAANRVPELAQDDGATPPHGRRSFCWKR